MAAPRHFDVVPVTGFLDLRSSPDQVAPNGYRYAKNFGVTQKSKLCRYPGWKKLLDRDNPNNFDGHDQLHSLTGESDRQPITFLYEAQSTLGTTKLLRGTQSWLQALNIATGNWKVIAKGLGVDGSRFYATQNQDNVIVTNDVDEPFYWNFDQPVEVGGDQSVSPITDLVALGVTRVGVVVTWAGCTFLMNVVQNGRTFQHRIIWSNYQNGLSYQQGEESVAGDQDLDYGETILAALPLANVLLIYTTRGIWQVNQSGDPDTVFGFSKRYDSKTSGEACLAYRNTLTSKGNEHIYAAQEGIYTYSLFDDKPNRVEYIHKASSIMFDDLNEDLCDMPISCFNPVRKEVVFSWPKSTETLPSQSLVINTEFPFTSILDHGFTCFGVFQPREPITILKDFIRDNCICTDEEIEEFGDSQEGGFCIPRTPVTCDDGPPDSFFTTVPLELEDDIVTEDWNEVEPSENSLCAQLGSLTLADLCVAESKAGCKPSRIFVMASASDFCLKEMSDIYYRELCTSFEACGTYEKRGYRSLLRSGPINIKDTEDEKVVKRFVMEAEAAVAAVPGKINLRVGASAQALDPNQTTCPIIWVDEGPKDLQCLSDATAAEHAADNTRPDEQYAWPTFVAGMNFYYELEVLNDDPALDFADTGAPVCISRYTIFADPSRRNYP